MRGNPGNALGEEDPGYGKHFGDYTIATYINLFPHQKVDRSQYLLDPSGYKEIIGVRTTHCLCLL